MIVTHGTGFDHRNPSPATGTHGHDDRARQSKKSPGGGLEELRRRRVVIKTTHGGVAMIPTPSAEPAAGV